MHRLDMDIQQTILSLLRQRAGGRTICPSEAARAVAASKGRAVWEPLMPAVRRAAERMAAQGLLHVTQHGHIVDGATAKGPVRLRLR